MPNKNASILSYNVYNNSFAIKYKDNYYESALYLNMKNSNNGSSETTKGGDNLLCIGHVKLVLSKVSFIK